MRFLEYVTLAHIQACVGSCVVFPALYNLKVFLYLLCTKNSVANEEVWYPRSCEQRHIGVSGHSTSCKVHWSSQAQHWSLASHICIYWCEIASLDRFCAYLNAVYSGCVLCDNTGWPVANCMNAFAKIWNDMDIFPSLVEHSFCESLQIDLWAELNLTVVTYVGCSVASLTLSDCKCNYWGQVDWAWSWLT